ncbi:MAG: hypothetical protein DRI95_05705 [Bacteroidetes bacterium]|nr:MAG: hypothetical protein DRI95_05705 [Bacteroidota bacterium]
MQFFLFLGIIVSYSFLNIQESNKEKEMISAFGYTRHVNSEGNPSRFDGDYYSLSLVLYDDKSYLYTFQKGRLEPRYKKETGSWEISDVNLILSAKKRHNTIFSNKEIEKIYTGKTYYTLKEKKLCDFTGKECLENRKGLPAWKLFSEYK